MFDWQTTDDHDTLPDVPDEQQQRWRLPDRWPVYVGLLVLVVLAAGLVLRWRVQERTEAMRADLAEFVRYEEQQRRFGVVEEAGSIYVRNAPTEWKVAYVDTFGPSDATRPVSVMVGDIEFDGVTAVATVHLGRETQLRAFRLTDRGWQRAPLPEDAWGGERTARLTDGITLRYRERDGEFVQGLLADVRELARYWPVDETVRQVIIEPAEFAPPVRRLAPDTIVLNSPLLASSERGLSGAEAARFELAHELLQKAPSRDEYPHMLPNAMRFGAAARGVVIARWALAPETYDRMRASWQAQLPSGRWKSPFLDEWFASERLIMGAVLWSPDPAEVFALSMADYLYSEAGAEPLAAAALHLPTAPSWDSVFRRYFDRYTVEAEADGRAALYDEQRPTENGDVKRDAPDLPLDVTVSAVEAGNERFTVRAIDGGRHLRVQAADATVVGPNGDALPTGCAGLYRHLTLHVGDWRVPGEHLQARRVSVHALAPAISPGTEVSPAPPNTVGYFVFEEQIAGETSGSARLAALGADGTVTDLVDLTGVRPVWGTDRNVSATGQVLLQFSLPNCNQAWLFLYDPERGIVARWLTAPDWRIGRARVAWHAGDRDILLFGVPTRQSEAAMTFDGPWQYGTLPTDAASGQSIAAQGTLDEGRRPLGWYAEPGYIVAVDQVTPQEAAARLIDPQSTEEVDTFVFRADQPTAMTLSDDGSRLIYSVVQPNGTTVVRMLDLESGKNSVFLRGNPGENLWTILGAQPSGHVLLASVTPEPEYDRGLVVADLTDGRVTRLDGIANDEDVVDAVPCSNGQVLVTVERRGTDEVGIRLWHPGGEVEPLLTTSAAVRPWACLQ